MSITNNWCLNNFPIYSKKSGYDVKHFVLLAKEEELCRRITEANEDKKYAKDHYKEQLLYVHNNLMNEEIIYTDNGGEFHNKLFKNYCKNNDIILLHGRPRYPQT